MTSLDAKAIIVILACPTMHYLVYNKLYDPWPLLSTHNYNIPHRLGIKFYMQVDDKKFEVAL